MKQYKIMRDCCTAGNCIVCRGLRYGDKVTVEHHRVTDKVLADQIAENFKLYHAVVVEVTK